MTESIFITLPTDPPGGPALVHDKEVLVMDDQKEKEKDDEKKKEPDENVFLIRHRKGEQVKYDFVAERLKLPKPFWAYKVLQTLDDDEVYVEAEMKVNPETDEVVIPNWPYGGDHGLTKYGSRKITETTRFLNPDDFDHDVSDLVDEAQSFKQPAGILPCVYRVGHPTVSYNFDPSPNTQCSHRLHFYLIPGQARHWLPGQYKVFEKEQKPKMYLPKKSVGIGTGHFHPHAVPLQFYPDLKPEQKVESNLKQPEAIQDIAERVAMAVFAPFRRLLQKAIARRHQKKEDNEKEVSV
jgi:hypothetical protein